MILATTAMASLASLVSLAVVALPTDIADSAAAVGVVHAGTATGAAVVVDDGIAVTAAHVVGSAGEVTIEIGGDVRPASVAERSTTLDLAVLDLDTDGIVPLELAPDLPRLGTAVTAIGAPGGRLTLTQGIVSRVDPAAGGPDVIQTDAAVNPGNSGGALVGDDGVLVGIVVAKDDASEGVGFAVASTTIRAFLTGELGGDEAPPGSSASADPPRDSDGSTSSRAAVAIAVGAGGLVAALVLVRRSGARRARRAVDPEIVLHSRPGDVDDVVLTGEGSHAQP